MSLKLFSTVFIITGVVSFGSDWLAFSQSERGHSKRQSLETERQADALLQNALRLSDDRDSKPARQQLQEAMHMWMQLDEPEAAAKAAAQMGDRCKQARRYHDALRYFRQALELKPLRRQIRSTILNAIGQIYADLYVMDLAERYFTQALEQARIVNDLSAQTIALTGLGEIYIREGQLVKSVKPIENALRLRENSHADPDPALLYLKGRIRQQQGLLEDAKRSFDETFAIYTNTGDVAGQVRVLCAYSTLSLLVSHKQVALEQAEQAGLLAENEEKRAATPGSHLGDHWNISELQWHAWLIRARVERALGNGKRALKCYSTAIDYFEGLWLAFYVTTETSAVAFREEAQAAYRETIDLLMEQGKFKDAYFLADEDKARTLLNFRGARAARQRSEDDEQAPKLRKLFRSIVHSRSQLRDSRISGNQRVKLQRGLQEAEYEIKEARLETEMEHIRERWVWSNLVTADQLQNQMNQQHNTLAEFSLGEERSFLWLFTGGEVYSETLPSRKEIEDMVKPHLDAISAAPNPMYVGRDLPKLRGRSEALFAMLFGHLASQIKPGQQLIIVPDGVLHYLPFEALIHNDRYLVEDHEISYSPSASVLVQSRESNGKSETGDRMELLAFGDPIFGPELKASSTRRPGSRPINAIQDAHLSPEFKLPPLPRTRDEVQFIAGLFPAHSTRLYLGKDSTEDAVKRESLRRYRRLHFATHSLIDERSPFRSAVVLTQNNSPDEDGFLDVNEISELDLDCDLVVLSACQTGRGQLLSGEGIVGFTRAFLYAGAQSVVVSLWSVSDISTGQLMKNFYQDLVGNHRNAAALRSAKLLMLHSGIETRHPYYWAPFVLVGKP